MKLRLNVSAKVYMYMKQNVCILCVIIMLKMSESTESTRISCLFWKLSGGQQKIYSNFWKGRHIVINYRKIAVCKF